MTHSTGDDLDRTTSGRFVRNLALSLSGGALVTLIGASAAHADDLSDAGTVSDGTGAAHSGDATAVGNQSGTNTTQTVTVSGNLGTIQVINQQANVVNGGVGISNTGGNIAIGNSSDNTATGTQTGTGLGPVSNTGTAANGSNGSASVSTGNSSSIGNQSSTTINQTANGQAHGLLGGILVINQDATVTNSGVALANSGGNLAVGNDSTNDAGLLQDANTAAGIAANGGKATNNSDGKATINTGNASATGNKSDTSITQSATGSAGGALGGLVIIDQDAFVTNAGAAVANTGANLAAGNVSTNTSDVDQTIGDAVAPDPIGVASNNGEASNTSGGTAAIRTGDATAVGNDSRTSITQNATSDIEGFGGGAIISQGTNVLNLGIGVANSGGNLAVGNNSGNTATTTQDAPSSGAAQVGVVGNFGLASNTSDGNGSVDTGKAWAAGSISQTDVTQNALAEGGAFNLLPQVQGVQNLGAGFSNSGINAGVGNNSGSAATVTQTGTMPPAPGPLGVGVLGNFGMATNSSDGTASITTGDAAAFGNRSTTEVSQTIDPTGLIIPVQVSNVSNTGLAVANSGGNLAVGNNSGNAASTTQTADLGSGSAAPVNIVAGTLVGSNNGEASNASDGTATISTGDAWASGNDSATEVHQGSNAGIDGLGLVVNTQAASVTNAGVGIANSGLNAAAGNVSQNGAQLTQDVNVGADNPVGPTNVVAGILTASNNGTASNASDGTASISTGDAAATGNRSATYVAQAEDASVDGLGGVINTQVAVVGNVGLGVANSGVNGAVGNASINDIEAAQTANVGSGNADTTNIVGGLITAGNNGAATNASDGKATIATGKADATGNASSTQLTQVADGDIGGLGLTLNTQIGTVANAGVGVANSGVNGAVGNVSLNDDGNNPDLVQVASVGSNNTAAAPTDILAGQIVANNSGEASNASDGTAEITTGGAQGQGNVSSTNLAQKTDGSVDGLGLVLNTQVGGVANVGAGFANSGVNVGVGNASGQLNGGNGVVLTQNALVGSNNANDPTDITAGSAIANNSGQASNASDGTAKVKTGGALATGNTSATNLTQNQSGNVSGLGLVIGTEVGGVLNAGIGIANTGVNGAVGNISINGATNTQNAELGSDSAAPATPLVILGPAVASNSGEASNASDGEACVCTGDAVASGNVSSTTLLQDLDLSTGSGTVVLTAAGGVANAGLGVANSGINGAIGNVSNNTATTTQDAVINDALIGLPIVGPQVANNGGGATNTSTGKALVASGNASGTGNQSTTTFAQAADVDSPLAISSLVGGTTNLGAGLANSGLNLGVGNASTNTAVLDQDADGAGIVSNSGSADNDSDGTAIIGDPADCDDDKTTPTTPPTSKPEETPGLPRTGGPLEVEAAIGLMLLLLGFGLRRRGLAQA